MINSNGIKLKQTIRNIVIYLLLASICITGCNGNNILDSFLPPEISTPDEDQAQVPLTKETVIATPAPTESSFSSNNFTIWIPPQFDPNADTESGNIMLAHIDSFQEIYPQYAFDIRIKAERGPSSLLNTLQATSSAAPGVLPSVVLISRSDLETAAAQGIILPVESLSSAIDESDWFPFAKEMGIIQGETYGLPFAADAVGLVTKENVIGSKYLPLIEARRRMGTTAFAAGDSNSVLPFILYQSGGGHVEDQHGQPIIEFDQLSNMFESIEENRRFGVFSSDLVEYQSDKQVWTAFTENEFEGVLTWLSQALSEPDNYFISPLPGIGNQPYTYANGWIWCMVDKKNNNQELSISFIENMIDPLFLSEWIPKAGYLPVRPSSITGFNATVQATLNNLLLFADIMPNEITLSYAKSDIIKAAQDLLQGLSTTEESTQEIMDKLESEQTQ